MVGDVNTKLHVLNDSQARLGDRRQFLKKLQELAKLRGKVRDNTNALNLLKGKQQPDSGAVSREVLKAHEMVTERRKALGKRQDVVHAQIKELQTRNDAIIKREIDMLLR